MRKIRLLTVILLLSFLLSPTVIGGNKSGLERKPVFDYIIGEPGNRVCLRLPRKADSIKALLYCHQNMTEEVLFRSPLFTGKMDSLGVAMAFVQSGSQNWDVTEGCQERFENIIADLAAVSCHKEIANAPVIPFGHSAQATFPWNFVRK